MTVLINHPGLPEAPPARTTEEAFNAIWKPKGWQIADTPQTEQTEAPAQVATEPAGKAATKKTGA
ncbi:hypothetical protein [Cellulomonas sp. C5510]|uniref:hypothetical protein n=1 Tax=Cellulomonas sp. C5510 TaxID=2871170 RepID=UPI001C988308|nr:hypothetical protein [Cellulomonas sp. C5510]QZN86880.1 hypothetical protein K5O09_07155 [Cellulomonas sp. C5510]